MTPTLPKARLTAFGALFFCYFAAVGSFNPFAPLWFKELGFSTLAIGAIASLQAWSRVLAPYAWSWWGDHGGRRTQLIRLAALVSLVAALGLLWARGYAAVATCTLLLFMPMAVSCRCRRPRLRSTSRPAPELTAPVMAVCACGARWVLSVPC